MVTCTVRTRTSLSNHDAKLNNAENLTQSWVISSKAVPSPEIKLLSFAFGETAKRQVDNQADVTYRWQFLQMNNKALEEC